MTHNKQNKYNYLQHSFQKQLQRSYDRNRQSSSSPPHQIMSPPTHIHLNSNANKITQNIHNNNNNAHFPHSHNSPSRLFRSPPRSSQFSPYQNKEQNIRDRILVQQLKNHNKVLNQQIQEYKKMVQKLQKQIRIRVQESSHLQKIREKQRILHQDIVREMKEQIGVLLKKNLYLDDRNIVLEKQIRKIQAQISKNQARTRSLSVAAQNSKQNSSKLSQQLSSILQSWQSKPKKRDNGKINSLNQTYSNINSTLHSPKPLSLSLSQTTIISTIQYLLHKLQKYQQLSQSIKEMYGKINGKKLSYYHHQEHNQAKQGKQGKQYKEDKQGKQGKQKQCIELKYIWKWLKQLGHHYNIVQKWKKILIDLLGIGINGRNQTDIGIQEVMEKVIVRLHGK